MLRRLKEKATRQLWEVESGSYLPSDDFLSTIVEDLQQYTVTNSVSAPIDVLEKAITAGPIMEILTTALITTELPTTAIPTTAQASDGVTDYNDSAYGASPVCVRLSKCFRIIRISGPIRKWRISLCSVIRPVIFRRELRKLATMEIPIMVRPIMTTAGPPTTVRPIMTAVPIMVRPIMMMAGPPTTAAQTTAIPDMKIKQ